MTGVHVEGVSFGYSRRASPVLSDLTLRLAGPGSVGLLGPNGSGKTTLVKLLATVLTPERGWVEISGVRADSTQAVRNVRKGVGYLPQRFGYFKGFTAEEFVGYCLWIRGAPTPRGVIADALDAVGMADLRGTRMGSFSGGQAQRVGIAQAIAGAPPLVILDEPSAGLDPEQRIQMRTVLRGLVSSLVVMSTHLIEDVIMTTNDVVVIHEGRIVHHGATRDLPGADRTGGNPPAGYSAAEGAYLQVLSRPGTRP